MPLSGKMAVDRKFFNEKENIYTAQKPWSKSLIYGEPFDQETGDLNYIFSSVYIPYKMLGCDNLILFE